MSASAIVMMVLAMLVIWGGLVVALTIAVAARGGRRQVYFVGVLAMPVLADLYLSYAGDAIEVGRHLQGPMLRFGVVVVVAAAVLADTLLQEVSDRACT